MAVYRREITQYPRPPVTDLSDKDFNFMFEAFKNEKIKPLICSACKREFTMAWIVDKMEFYPATGGCERCSNEHTSD